MSSPAVLSPTLLADLIQRCAFTSNALRKARQLHAVVLATSTVDSPPFLNNNLITLYAKAGSIMDALSLFDAMPARNLVSYSAVISACSRVRSHAPTALRFLPEMVSLGMRPNGLALASLLHATLVVRDVVVGSVIHSLAVKDGFVSDGAVQTALLSLYGDCAEPECANRVFDEMVHRDVIAWNSIIISNLKNDGLRKGLDLFSCMMKTGLLPSEFTFSMVLSACRRLGYQSGGELIHALITKMWFMVDVPLQNALLDMYSSCGDLDAAVAVFREIEMPVLISWNTLLSGYSDDQNAKSALDLFIQLRSISSDQMSPDEYTYAAVVSAAAGLPAESYGKPLHAQVEKVGLVSSIFVGSTLIDMYFNNQEQDSACKIFNSILHKDAIAWTSMIVGHSRLGEGETAMSYFRSMIMEGCRVDSFSLSSALNSSAELPSLRQGEAIHSHVVRTGYEADICVCGSLIDMYAKNGVLQSSRSIFDRVENLDLKCWNAMLGGYGNHGNAQRAFDLFDGIAKNGLQADHVTFVSLLSACSHCCLVERGRYYWDLMIDKGLLPEKKHYACMVNLLSRAGHLQEAEQLISGSPFSKKLPELWRNLLSSCVTFNNLSLGIYAAEQVLISEPDDSPTLIMLSNLYASFGMWEDVSRIRRKMRGMMLDKDPGLSWIEIRSKVHVFSADDEYHEHVEDARNELQRLQENMKGQKEEYVILSVNPTKIKIEGNGKSKRRRYLCMFKNLKENI